ncbi:MAG: DUF3987 domain-containing protein [Planctomycetes bacterium]|nr:DUF3987 domain-containing protein [Planctomycetota bacterium]
MNLPDITQQDIDAAFAGTADGEPVPDETQYLPFPLEILPEPIRLFIESASDGIGCDPAYVALPVLAVLAAAVGNTRRIELKPGWREPVIVWTVVVGESGTSKSPAFGAALEPVRDLQTRAMAEYTDKLKEYDRERLYYERDLADWKKGKSNGEPPAEPERPAPDRQVTDDATIEALAGLLQDQPHGILLARDELSGWIGSFDRYARGNGDAPRWLEMFQGRSITVDRRGGGMTHVPRASVSVTGGIQPGVMREDLTRKYFENGLAARLLVAMPPRRAKRWSKAGIDPRAVDGYRKVVEGLYDLDTVYVDSCMNAEPEIIPLSEDGEAAWSRFYNEHNEEQVRLSGDLAAMWSKLEGYVPRLALLIHSVREVIGDPALRNPKRVDAASIDAAVMLVRWFGREARRVYAVLREPDGRREQRQLIEKIRGNGGSMTVRELRRSSSLTTEDAEVALEELHRMEAGRWVHDNPGPRGGRAPRRFVLLNTTATTATAITPDSDAREEVSAVAVTAVPKSHNGADRSGA